MGNYREFIKDKKRIVIKIGSSSLMHEQTGRLDLLKIEKLVRILIDIKNSGKDVVLVSSGAIAVGRAVIGLCDRPTELPVKQACASIGQAKLMMVYQKIFAEYGAVASQVLLTKNTIVNWVNNAVSTIHHYWSVKSDCPYPPMRLSAIVASIIGADLLILLSDIDGLYTDDPNTNPNAKFVETVYEIDEKLMGMGKDSSGSNMGTGGMTTKLIAGKIATLSGADMIITNGNDVDNIIRVMAGENVGTLFLDHRASDFDLMSLID